MTSQTAGDILVIGYGNELRGDDATGLRVAEAVAAWQLPGVRALAVPQLTPDLSEAIAAARQVVFVDATIEPSIQDVQLRPLDATAVDSGGSHRSDPRALVALARAVFGQAPPAWLMAVPAADFAFGAPLSSLAQRGVEAALARLRQFCAESAPSE
jgi:hydrogenase maturation protease